MSEKKYMYCPLEDMNILFDNVFGANFTRAVISGETPKDDKWISPFFTNRVNALIFQDILISQLSIEATPSEKLEAELMTGDMYYGISLSVLLKLRNEVDIFLRNSKDTMTVEGQNSVLAICGLGSAGVPRLYNKYNQYLTPYQIAECLNELDIADPKTLKIYITSNASAAERNYTFENMDQMHEQFAADLRGDNNILASLIGTQGSLAAEVYGVLNDDDAPFKKTFSDTEVYGYLFPYLTQGIEAYGIDESENGLSKWKTLSMAALASVYTKDKEYYQQIPIRRSLTKVKITSS